ncbi:hypothetical protein D3C78_600090 [compost metagenome]
MPAKTPISSEEWTSQLTLLSSNCFILSVVDEIRLMGMVNAFEKSSEQTTDTITQKAKDIGKALAIVCVTSQV